MKKNGILGLFILVLITTACKRQTGELKPRLSDDARASLMLIPLPTAYTSKPGKFLITQGIHPYVDGVNTANVVSAISRFEDRMNKMGLAHITGNTQGNLRITCLEASAGLPYLDMDESYTLSIEEDVINLEAAKYFGIERGLQTLTYLLQQAKSAGHIPCARIGDEPRFPWRGIMLDVSRHWIPKNVVLRNIDAMASVKLNVLHLHLSDDQGFRMESKVYPKLHEEGSGGEYYSQDDMKEIVAYAAQRGIRVVPEFDLPGHISSWLAGYPDLATRAASYKREKGYGIFPAVLNPSRQATFQFLSGLFAEMAPIFPDEYVHVGGDEVLLDHWKESEEVGQFMKDKGIRQHSDLRLLFAVNCEAILDRLGKKMIGWDDIIHREWATEKNVVQAWHGHEELYRAANMGFSALSSSGWYLDHKTSLESLYAIDPVEFPGLVSIEPDSTRWSVYQVKGKMRNNDVDGTVYFFGPRAAQRGLVFAFDQVRPFEKVAYNGNDMEFFLSSLVGRIRVKATTDGDSIFGTATSLIGRFDISGIKVGGHDVENGVPFPSYRKAEPLDAEEKKRILGGEACVWTEWLDQGNVESRIWPRIAAPAERLWSPLAHIGPAEDLYRRTAVLDSILPLFAVDYKASFYRFIDSIGQPEKRLFLERFMRQLEEVKYYERYTYFPNHNIDAPLDALVDAVLPESLDAREFDLAVARYRDNSNDDETQNVIYSYLDEWIPLYSGLKDLLQDDPRLQKVEFLCLVLSDLSKIARLKMSGGSLNPEEEQYYLRIREEAVKPRAGVYLAPAADLIELIDIYMQEI